MDLRGSIILGAFVVAIAAVHLATADHFRGGTMTWKPVPQDGPGKQRQVRNDQNYGLELWSSV